MKKLDYSSTDFFDGKFLFTDDYFYKIIDEDKKKVLDIILDNKDKLNAKNLCILNGYYLTQDGKLCYQTDLLKSHRKLDILFYLAMELDIKKIAMDISKSYVDLLSLGLEYFDFHPGNLFLDKDDNPVLIDLDGAEIYTKYDNLVVSLKFLVQLIFHMIVTGEDYFVAPYLVTLDYIDDKYDAFNLYDKKVRKILKYILFYDPKALKYDVLSLVEKICEEDKVQELKRRALGVNTK